MTFLITLGTIAASLALSRAMDDIDHLIAKGNKVTSDDVIKTVNKMVDEASQKGANILDRLYNKLNAIDIPFIKSSSLKSYISKVKKDMNDDINKTKEDINAVENSLNNIRERSNAFQYSSDAAKNNMKQLPDELMKETQDQINKINEIERRLKDA